MNATVARILIRMAKLGRVVRWGLGSLLLVSCVDEPPPMEEPEDYTRAPEAPADCTLSALALECTDGVGEIPTAFGGGGGLGGSGPVGEASCILRRSAQLLCPSQVSRLAVGRGSAGELDVAVAQKGRDGLDEFGSAVPDLRLHLAALRLGLGDTSAEVHALAPGESAERVTLAIVPGNEDGDSLLALHRSTLHPDPGLDFIAAFSGGETLASVDATGFGRPLAAAGPVGTRGYVDVVSSSISLVEGLVEAPRRVDLGSALAAALDYDDIGEPYVLLHQGSELRLLGGPEHDELLWSEVREPSTSAEVDLLVGAAGVAERRAMLVRDSEASKPDLRVQEGDQEAGSGWISRGTRGCDGWTLNVECSDCPVNTACENSEFLTRGARLFSFGERTLVAVVWTEQVESRVTDTDVSLLGICVCDSTLIDKSAVAEYLSIYDVGYRGPQARLEFELVFEQLIGDGNDVGDFGFARDAEDGLTFWYGPYLNQPEGSLPNFPEQSTRYIIERLGGTPDDE